MKKFLAGLILIATFFFTVNFSFLFTARAQTESFTDVTTENENFTAIEKLKADGVIGGYDNGDYKPDQEVNRAEFMKIVIGTLTPTPKGKNCFSDVNSQWFASFICEAKVRGVVSGDGNFGKVFRPGDKINFAEASKVMAKAYALQTGQEYTEAWYKKFVASLAAEKAVPLSVEFFDENLTRGEVAEMLWRLKDGVDSKASRSFDEINGTGLYTAASCVDLQARYAHSIKGDYGYGGYGGGIMMDKLAAPAPEATSGAVDDAAQSEAAPAKDYSATNVQVEGVDEADVIKNDGKYIYVVKGSTVRIVEAYPVNNLKEVGTVKLSDSKSTFTPKEIYVDGNKLVVIGSTYDAYSYEPQQKMMMPAYYGSNKTKVFILDVTDHANPKVLRSVDFNGDYDTSRRIGGTLYMVMNKYPSYPFYYNQEMKETDLKPEEFLPMMKDSKVGKNELIVPCDKVKIFPKPESFNFLITAAVPLDDLTKDVNRTVIVGSTDNVYASQNNLYVAASHFRGGFYMPYNLSEETRIYKFALGNGSISYVTDGQVPGNILNQFSMDEHNGNFRIATTRTTYTDEESITDNNLYILDSNLKNLGKIERIAPGESIYAVRFLGNRAYMVTFKQIDPLFVIDVADAKNPKILGKLKIPGYSNYLHPYDQNHILGFGKDVDESIDADKVHSGDAVYYTAVLGMKIGLFDVTDVNHPKEMFKEVIGGYGTTSELLNNHKALLFDKDKQLLSFPVTVYEGTAQDNKLTFVGAYVYKFNLQDGFKLLGKITHLSDDELKELDLKGYYYTYNKAIQRILYIGQNLYTVSKAMVKANNLADLKELKSVVLAMDGSEMPNPPLWPF